MYSADDVLEMSVVRGVRGVVCEICMAWGEVGREGVSGLEDWVWDLPILWEQGEGMMCVGDWVAVVWVVSGSWCGRGWARAWEAEVVLCMCVNSRFRYLCTVLCGYLSILGAPSVQSCCTLSIDLLYPWQIMQFQT